MDLPEVVKTIANALKKIDTERPIFKNYAPGIGPFGEPQIVKRIAKLLIEENIKCITKRHPDLEIRDEWAIEFKIVRPFGDNGKEAENWTVNLLHPYEGNSSLIGDAINLNKMIKSKRKGLFVIGYEHNPAKIQLDPLLKSFEIIVKEVSNISLSNRVEERRENLVHPEHQVVRCIGWEILDN